ncbi:MULTISPECIES: GntR family transcriptional regulator [Enterococcus]|uniref:HTH gntR-type domain-containing protein n=1 Tax=Enterococcus diestrammenae TaxID=1155073 RepID=A0ABV0F031_9ENTE|nr:GntR family transcriptional regulator [Enterococcus diestrammenae]KAF1299844.1 GntR family transcriptional regulator [Enterococcus diestrammenae]HIX70651.1 GntR family transcriptional regulator [Candidatus Enterococcus stercoravium]
MLLEIDTRSETPIYQQLRDQIILGIASNQLAEGELLPTVRQLADELGVNTMTISKAYNLLKEEGYLVTDRRKGSLVTLPGSYHPSQSTAFKQRLALLLAEAKAHQVSQAEITQIITDIWQSFNLPADD